MPPRPLLLLRSLRHTRARQLRRRAALQAKRGLRVILGRLGWGRAGREVRPPPLAPDPPLPLLRDDRSRVRREGDRATLRLLGQDVPLGVPMDWWPELPACRELGRLAIHYLDYLGELDDRTLVDISGDWIRSNPPYGRRYWREAWNSYGLSIRCLSWMRELAARPALRSRPDVELMLSATAAQLRFLERNLETDLGGNHLLKNALALLHAGRFFAGPEAERWARTGTSLLDEVLDEQVLPDGCHFEGSPSYHCQVFSDLLECLRLLPAAGLRERLDAVLVEMAQVVADLEHPDGFVSQLGDGGLRMAPSPGTCLGAFRGATGRDVVPRAVFGLSTAGIYGHRWQDDLLVVDCGPVGPDHLPAHGHGDLLSFEWSVGGRRVFVDHGVFEYDAGPWRARARATGSHNTLSVDWEDQAEFWSSFRVGRRPRILSVRFEAGEDGFRLEGCHDGYRRLAGDPVHRRAIEARPGRLEVADTVDRGAGQKARAGLLLHPDCRVEPLDETSARVTAGSVAVVVRASDPLTVRPYWWCPDLGVRMDTTQLVIDYGPVPTSGGFTVAVESR